VEDYLALDIRVLKEALAEGGSYSLQLVVPDDLPGIWPDILEVEVSELDRPSPWLWIAYTLPETEEQMHYRIRLGATWPHFGGVRWWLVCPLVTNGRRCGRRVTKLYIGSQWGRYFGCRMCWNLTYTSCLESGKYGCW
jgi:hypothetical protein